MTVVQEVALRTLLLMETDLIGLVKKSDDREAEAREENPQLVLQRFLVARVRRRWLHSSHCSKHTELGVHRAWLTRVSAINTDSRPRMRVLCRQSVLTTAIWPQGENLTRRVRLFCVEKTVFTSVFSP